MEHTVDAASMNKFNAARMELTRKYLTGWLKTVKSTSLDTFNSLLWGALIGVN